MILLSVLFFLIVFSLNSGFGKDKSPPLQAEDYLVELLDQIAQEGTQEERRNNEFQLIEKSFRWMKQKGVDMRNMDPGNLPFLFHSFLLYLQKLEAQELDKWLDFNH